MPTYTIVNKKTEEEFDVFMTWTELQEMLKENPDLNQKLTTPGFVQAAKTPLRQAGEGWRDHLKRIKKTSGRGNTINV